MRSVRFLFFTGTDSSCTGLVAGGGAMGRGKPRKIITRKIGKRQKKSGVFQFSFCFIIDNKWRRTGHLQGGARIIAFDVRTIRRDILRGLASRMVRIYVKREEFGG
jgi:hypothetical protein